MTTKIRLVGTVICLFSIRAFGQAFHPAPYSSKLPNPADVAAEKEATLAQQQRYFVPRDPWREMTFVHTNYSGVILATKRETNYAKGPEWMQFTGTVEQISKGQIIVFGWYGRPMDFDGGQPNIFFRVMNFPYPVRLGTPLLAGSKWTAQLIKKGHSENNPAILDYGHVIKQPDTTSPLTATNTTSAATIATK